MVMAAELPEWSPDLVIAVGYADARVKLWSRTYSAVGGASSQHLQFIGLLEIGAAVVAGVLCRAAGVCVHPRPGARHVPTFLGGHDQTAGRRHQGPSIQV